MIRYIEHKTPQIVVSGLIMNDKAQVLMALRKQSQTHRGAWELPGGKVEGGEPERLALQRELMEELGAKARVGALISTTSLFLGKQTHLLLYHCTIGDFPEPKPLESEKLAWVDVSAPEIVRTGRHHYMPSFFMWYPDIWRFVNATIDSSRTL